MKTDADITQADPKGPGCLQVAPRQPHHAPRAEPGPGHLPKHGFTLIEFILVMALLAIVMAFSAPSLSRFFRQRHLEEEATRFLALTEYGRNEAVSQGLPMVIWVDPQTRQYGLEVKPGFPVQTVRDREFTLHKDVQFDLKTKLQTRNSWVEIAEFAPDGSLELHSLEAVSLIDQHGGELVVAQTTNGWGYEILKPTDYVSRNLRR